MSARNLSDFLRPYLPELVETLRRDLEPLSREIMEPTPGRYSSLLAKLFEKTLPVIFPFLARRVARSGGNRYSDIVKPLIAEHFLAPYAAEKARIIEEDK